MSFVMGASLLALVTALACTLPGTFVVLRRSSMLVDAISHAILPGIVLGYLITRDLRSPVLIVGAAVAGLVVVVGSEWLTRSGLVTGDAPQGLVFPALFSIGVLLVSTQFADVHLDTHAVLVGDLNLAAFGQLTIGGVPVGPQYLFVMLGLLTLNAVMLAVLFPRLTLDSFDPGFARSLGPASRLASAALMLLIAVTVTAGFHAAGAILVVALVVVPPATARLLTRRVPQMVIASLLVAAVGALGGFWLAYWLDAATSAGMAVAIGLVFVAVLAGRGLRRAAVTRRRLRLEH